MPSYRGRFGHRNQTLGMALMLCVTPFITGDWRDATIPIGALIGLTVSPDLDLVDPRGLMNPILDYVGFTEVYKDAIPHRHKVSHTPFISTVIRFTVVLGLPILCLVGFAWMARIEFPWWAIPRVFVGLAMADALHCLADTTKTWIRRLK